MKDAMILPGLATLSLSPDVKLWVSRFPTKPSHCFIVLQDVKKGGCLSVRKTIKVEDLKIKMDWQWDPVVERVYELFKHIPEISIRIKLMRFAEAVLEKWGVESGAKDEGDWYGYDDPISIRKLINPATEIKHIVKYISATKEKASEQFFFLNFELRHEDLLQVSLQINVYGDGFKTLQVETAEMEDVLGGVQPIIEYLKMNDLWTEVMGANIKEICEGIPEWFGRAEEVFEDGDNNDE